MVSKLKLATLASAIALATSVTVPAVQAEEFSASASFAASNMYLWRGVSISDNAPAVSGSLDAGFGGLYAGVWTSSEGSFSGGSEIDLYVGYANEVGGLSYDLAVVEYMYPDSGNDFAIGELSETILSLGFAGVGLSVYFNNADFGEQYITLGYEYEKLGVTYGTWNYEADAWDHLDFTFAATDELSFTLSLRDTDAACKAAGPGNCLPSPIDSDDDPLFAVTYSKSFDL